MILMVSLDGKLHNLSFFVKVAFRFWDLSDQNSNFVLAKNLDCHSFLSNLMFEFSRHEKSWNKIPYCKKVKAFTATNFEEKHS